MPSNAHDVAAAVLAHVGPVEAMRLQKLVYYSQAWHLALVDEPLFTDTIQAWRDGPVVVTLWDRHRGQRTVSSWPTGDPGRLSAAADKVVALVCQVYGGLSGDDLSELTHNELPWRVARQGVPDHQPSKAAIPAEEMKRFYRRRSLAGLSAADLVSGGLNGPGDLGIGSVERKQVLAAIRDDFRHPVTDAEPGFPEPVSSAFATDRGHRKPSRVEVRLHRERPQRGNTARRG
ncbi:Panacea domain-containing protein [Actinoplanes sp. NPDC051851]|uniref:Panacea domain-containing protein n=1 Tax=Actinoplanes sp. NPDC051851 TaxID=3154753 RepID=UPI00343E2171